MKQMVSNCVNDRNAMCMYFVRNWKEYILHAVTICNIQKLNFFLNG